MPNWLHSLDEQWFLFVTRSPASALVPVFAPLGLLAGLFVAWWSARLIRRESDGSRRLPVRGGLALVTAATVLFPALAVAVAVPNWPGSVRPLHVQWLTEGGSVDFAQYRIPFQFCLMCLLLVATAVDVDQYLIPDEITVTGTLVGVVWAVAIGNMHLVPVWVDWNEAHLLWGPYIPQWIKVHSHLHGLAFSLAGLATGAGLTWLARVISQTVLRIEALGFGDVTLMAMIGTYLGWQPVLFVFLLAPMCGLVVAVTVRLLHGRRAIPYGPYLSAAAVIVLFTWKWLWNPTREAFGHWQTLAAFAVLVCATLAVLLGLLRLYRAIPVTRRTESESGEPKADS